MNDSEFHDSVVASLATLEANASAQTQALARLEKVLLIGNGEPALTATVAALKADMATRISEARELREAVGAGKTTVRKESLITSTGVSTVLLGVYMALQKHFA